MAKRVTAEDVARSAGVSKWTVIRAFTPGASIAEKSRLRVLEAAENLNYRPNLLARSLATNLTHQVAILIDDFKNPHKLPVLEILTWQLQSEGLLTVLININEHFDHVQALLDAGQRQVDAIILFGTAFRPEMLEDDRIQGGAPLYVLARDSQIPNVPAITCDTPLAMRELCEYFSSKGYRRPAFLSGAKTLSTALGRRRAFNAFWEAHSSKPVLGVSAASYSSGHGFEAARILFQETPREQWPDLLMCENDALAFGAIDYVRSTLKLRIPDDIAIAGFDNTPLAASPAYDLTTYEQPAIEMVAAILSMILGREPRENRAFKGKLVSRSTA
ncbi:LacI family DNA-binding transcriptional regulator [Neorhizobium galegae]|uniref:Transcriptional regulator, LacI family n=1 Tax=Neorhizobium galegae bv. orientalis str. HAMBI 540 TaxID=1028800 RepID=A0A068STL7_NEOGA|nr:LacI family DNA-binding transcriptional regulator [Neorhizobium galegae]CDN49111.1 Transcriptional regulator, LacI family [Neorhizobium galegae bv. orientalis str. HAMBI 540]CDZ50481.1 Transcriptional regulator, LacI family [Neorhizobium galegae bv. orientalis]